MKLSTLSGAAARRAFSTRTRDRDSQTLTLPDGRIMGYAEYGHPAGHPLLFFHGFPSSRLEAWSVDKLARRKRLRILAPDRPGFGISTFQPGRRITDWPADVRALAGHLGLSRFAILGGSGGGPYALACALALPRDMMSAVGILAGAMPWEAGTKDVMWLMRASSMAATYTPRASRAMTDGIVALCRRIARARAVTNWLDRWVESVDWEKGEVVAGGERLTTEERREQLLRFGFEPFAQGAAGLVQEAELLTHPWGIKYENIAYDPIKIWHGTKDRNSPIGMMRYMANRLPHSVLVEYPEANHFALATHLEEILSDLISDEMLNEGKEKN